MQIQNGQDKHEHSQKNPRWARD